jgi:polyhydroxybutyrate depolymerase
LLKVKPKQQEMITGLVILLLLLATGLLYIYRWNIVHPLKSGVIHLDGLNRKFVYHVPKKLSPHPRLIILYHGTGMVAPLMQILTGHEFDELADREQHTIIVYPQGYKNNWNDCGRQAPYAARRLHLNDIEFTRQIIDYFSSRYQVNRQEVYAAGFSNGGQMVMKLARQQPQWFKGFAVISANMPVEVTDDCTDARGPVSLLLMNGQKDPINPFNGGTIILNGKNYGAVMSTGATLQYWLKVSACSTEAAAATAYPPPQTGRQATAYKTDYYSPVTRKQVSFVNILDGGHTIPNRNFHITIPIMGHINKDVDAPAIIWEFFAGLQ